MPTAVRAPVLIAALALLWGSSFFWIKRALDGLTPFQLTFARLALGALVLGLVVATRRLPIPRDRRTWGHLTVAALIANAMPYTLFAVAEQDIASNLAGTIASTTPLWTAVIAYTAGADRNLNGRRVLGLVVGFLGAVILASPWDTDTASTLGVLACLGAAICYGTSYVYQARFLTNRGHSPLVLAFTQLCAATVLLAIALPIDANNAPDLSGKVVTAILVLGLAGTGLAYVINFALITSEGPTAASVVTYLVPSVALALGAHFNEESVSAALLVGVLLTLVGTALVQRTVRVEDAHRPKA